MQRMSSACLALVLLAAASASGAEAPAVAEDAPTSEQQQQPSPPTGNARDADGKDAAESGQEDHQARLPYGGLPLRRYRVLDYELLLLPGSDLHRRYLADPGAPRHSIGWVWLEDDVLAGAGSRRVAAKVGGHFALVRLMRPERPSQALQVDFGGALLVTFDPNEDYDVIGWDGTYFAALSARFTPCWSAQIGHRHLSAHLGDEYLERVPRERIDYLRDEAYVAVAAEPVSGLRLYLETGFAYQKKAPVQKPWRGQAGIEFQTAPFLLDDLGALYAALDVQAWEETDWAPDVTAQTGLLFPLHDPTRTVRIGLQYYDGRTLLRDFTGQEETRWMIGAWLDL